MWAGWLHTQLPDEQKWIVHRRFEAIIHVEYSSTNINAFR